MLAESVRALEQDGLAHRDEPAADAAGRADAAADLETRIVRRAAALAAAPALREALHRAARISGWIFAALLVVAAVTGAAAVRTALGSPDAGASINVFWVLASLLGVQTLLLAVWVALIALAPRATSVAPLGEAAVACGRWLAGRGQRGTATTAALRAAALVHGRGAVGRWTFSAASHGLWTVANVGGVVMLIVLLSTREYTFHWETTILSAPAYGTITRAIAVVPELLGFPSPSGTDILASEMGASPGDLEAARVGWSGLLVGSVVAYALLPRLALFVFCAIARARALHCFRLDTNAPGYLLLRDRLLPEAEAGRVVDPDDGAPVPPSPGPATDARRAGSAPPVAIGLEIDRPPCGWPPPVGGGRWNDLGIVDAGADRRRVIEALSAQSEPPAATMIVGALTTTPDRGVGDFVAKVAAATTSPVVLVLTAGDDLRHRVGADGVARRAEDWRRLARGAGVAGARVVEVDLDHLTDASRRRLAEALGVDAGAAAAGERHVEAAFDLIGDAAAGWPAGDGAGPDPAAQVTLHRAIAGLYGHERGGWRRLLHVADDVAAAPLPALRAGSQRVIELLPPRLRRSPRWLAAGAIAGAMGCVAASAFVAPAAIGALPLWAAIGAAVSAALPGGVRGPTVPSVSPTAFTDAVRAATMFALLLELQGRDEATIGNVLDHALPPDGADDAPAGPAATPGWLNEVRHRYDLALAEAAR